MKGDRRLSFTTLRTYNIQIKNFNNFIKEKGREPLIKDIDSLFSLMILFIEEAKNINVARIRKNALKQSFLLLFSHKQTDFKTHLLTLFKEIKTGTVIPNIKSRSVDLETVKKLIVEANEELAIIIKILFTTGLRINELTTLTHKRIKADGDTYQLTVIGKGKKQRTVSISKVMFEETTAFYPKTADTDLFIYCHKTYKKVGLKKKLVIVKPFQYKNEVISTRLNRLGQLVMKRRLSAHDFRHSFATNKIKDGKPLKAVSRYLGHSSTAITSDYYVEATLDITDLLDKEIDLLKGRRIKRKRGEKSLSVSR